jgi:hypothetical protein
MSTTFQHTSWPVPLSNSSKHPSVPPPCTSMASRKSTRQRFPTEKGSALSVNRTQNDSIPKTSRSRPPKVKSPKKSTKRKIMPSDEDKDESESDQSISEYRHTSKNRPQNVPVVRVVPPMLRLLRAETSWATMNLKKTRMVGVLVTVTVRNLLAV